MNPSNAGGGALAQIVGRSVSNLGTVFAQPMPSFEAYTRLKIHSMRTDLSHLENSLAEFLKRPTPSQLDAAIVEEARSLARLWQAPRIAGLTRSERNAAIEETRARLIAAVIAADGASIASNADGSQASGTNKTASRSPRKGVTGEEA